MKRFLPDIDTPIRVDTDHAAWGRVVSDGRLVAKHGSYWLVDVFSIGASIMVPVKDCKEMN